MYGQVARAQVHSIVEGILEVYPRHANTRECECTLVSLSPTLTHYRIGSNREREREKEIDDTATQHHIAYDIPFRLSDRCDLGKAPRPQCALENQVLSVSCNSH